MIPAAGVLDRRQTVFVIVDVQERLASTMEHRDAVTSAVSLLLSAAVITGVPVIATRQYPQGLGDLTSEISAMIVAAESAGASITQVDKLSFDCFGEPLFVDAVAGSARRQIAMAGMETHICVNQTALTALREGYDVHVVTDGCCSRDEGSHAIALARLGNAGAVLSCAESAAYELVGRAGTDEFRELLKAVKAR